MIRNAHLFKTVNYDRKIGVLTREDYSYMRDLLETALEQNCKVQI